MNSSKISIIKNIKDYGGKLGVTLPDLSLVTWNDLRKLESYLRNRYNYTNINSQ